MLNFILLKTYFLCLVDVDFNKHSYFLWAYTVFLFFADLVLDFFETYLNAAAIQ